MAINKSIITAFSLLVGCGVVTAASLLYMSNKNDPYNMKYKDEKVRAINAVKKYDKEIQNINKIFKNYKIEDEEDEDEEDEEYKKNYQKQIIKDLVDGNISYAAAIEQANNFVNGQTKDENIQGKGRSLSRSSSISSDSGFSVLSNETIDGGKKTKRVIKRSKKSRSKKSKSKSKIYKKLI